MASCSGSRAVVLCLMCSLVAGCGVRSQRLELRPRASTSVQIHPLRVAAVVDKQFTPYKIKFRYWSTGNFTFPLEGLPDAFVNSLRPHFTSVEAVPAGRLGVDGRHDLIARMLIDRLHFDGANTTIGDDTVELTVTFTLTQPNGEAVFRRSLSARTTSAYEQRCAFCKPEPPDAFIAAFRTVFDQLTAELQASADQLPSAQD
jgi:hypothetical protein